MRTMLRDAGVLGAALMAGTGIGVFASLSKAAKNFVVMDRVFEPQASEKNRHDEGYEKYQLLYRQLVPLNWRKGKWPMNEKA